MGSNHYILIREWNIPTLRIKIIFQLFICFCGINTLYRYLVTVFWDYLWLFIPFYDYRSQVDYIIAYWYNKGFYCINHNQYSTYSFAFATLLASCIYFRIPYFHLLRLAFDSLWTFSLPLGSLDAIDRSSHNDFTLPSPLLLATRIFISLVYTF